MGSCIDSRRGQVLARALVSTALFLTTPSVYGWYGPICYSDRTTQVALTIPSISGETPGDLKVSFDDNDGAVALGAIRASKSVKNGHEVILIRDAQSRTGVLGVVVTSPRSTTGYKFELEFRKDASECIGAVIKTSDRGNSWAKAGEPAAVQAAGVAPARAAAPVARRPKAKPVQKVAAAVPAPTAPQPSPQPDVHSAAEALPVSAPAPAVQFVNLDEGKPALNLEPAPAVEAAPAQPAQEPTVPGSAPGDAAEIH